MKIDPYNFELYRFKVCTFFETQCRVLDRSSPVFFGPCVLYIL